MSRNRSLRVEILEDRMLLAAIHVAMPHPRVVVPHLRAAAIRTPPSKTPLVVDGTLNVAYRAISATTNADGSSTTTAPVSGTLGSLGRVHGTWNESVDSFGDPTGPDTLRLTDSKGTFVLAFNNENSGRGHPTGHGGVSFQHPQRFVGGTKAYASASEIGTVTLTTNPAKSQVVSISLQTTSS